METTFLITNYVISGFLITFLTIKIYYSYISETKIDNLITENYNKLEMNVINISKLNLTEKIKYGVPLNLLIRFYGHLFTFFSLKIKPVRKVELIDKNDNEYIKYIELVIRKRKLILCNEFDSYNF
ncbi:MAG: hypothetical protein GXO79_15540 [Chlorobi bacterium]|nr:hypothetical protein [Chlorobiota bacterium]